MAREVELKLSLPAKEQRRFLREAISPDSAACSTQRLVNIYYDTPDLELYRKGIALRLRKSSNRWIQTVKCSGTSNAGLSSRSEWEKPYSGKFDFAAVDDKRTQKRLNRVKSELSPIFETNFRRTEWRVRESGAELILSLDRGTIVANSRAEKISEVEIELAEGDTEPIFSFADQLMRRFPLGLGNSSKAERGYCLFLGRQGAPTHAVQVPLAGKISPTQAFHCVACASLDHVQRNHRGAVQGVDEEYLHQMRVGLRHLLAAFRLFKPVPQIEEPQLSWLHSLMKTLGKARDLDVVMADVIAPVARDNPDEANVFRLLKLVARRQTAARKMVVQSLSAPDYERHQLAVLSQLHKLANQRTDMNITLGDFADRRLRRLQKKLMRLADKHSLEDPRSLHRLRIAAKHLRYAVEFFSVSQTSKRIANLENQLVKLQNVLGQLNDLSNAGSILLDCAGNQPDLLHAVNFIGTRHRQRHADLVTGVSRVLTKIRSASFPKFGA